jgi:hypothetical protein
MEEMVKAVNVYEKDGVVVEETIEVPVSEFETLKEYMNGVDDDNQEEYNTEATGEMESLSDVEEGESEPEDEPEYDEQEELEELEEVVCVDTIEDDVPVVEAILLDQDEEVFLESFLDFDIEEDEDDDEEDID